MNSYIFSTFYSTKIGKDNWLRLDIVQFSAQIIADRDHNKMLFQNCADQFHKEMQHFKQKLLFTLNHLTSIHASTGTQFS